MASIQGSHRGFPLLIGPLLVSVFLLHSALLAVSQAAVTSAITPDGTLGTRITQSGTAFTISGGTITGRNQFHSFGRFSVGTGDRATFTGSPAIANIVSRVTGGSNR
jgi:large exoprotein involved in heme utilization and adhesion